MEASSSSTGTSASNRVFDESAFDPALLAMDQAITSASANAGASTGKTGKNSSSSSKGTAGATAKQPKQQTPASPKKVSKAAAKAAAAAAAAAASIAGETKEQAQLADKKEQHGDVDMEDATAPLKSNTVGADESDKQDTSLEDAIQRTPKQKSRSHRDSSVSIPTPSTVATPSPAKGKKASSSAAAQAAAAAAAASLTGAGAGAGAGMPPNKGTVFTAVYSNVPVFELMARGIGVMRRRSDNWLNATQILKVAGISKAQRTKILDKDIASPGSSIPFEKIQGGYGRYQGTWIPLHEGLKMAEQYNIMELIQPLIDYNPSPTASNSTLVGMSNSASIQQQQQQQPLQQLNQNQGQGPSNNNSGGAPSNPMMHQQQQPQQQQQYQQNRPPAGSPPATVGSINTEQAAVANLQKQKANQQLQLEQAIQSVGGTIPSATNTNGQSPFSQHSTPLPQLQQLPPLPPPQQQQQQQQGDLSSSTSSAPPMTTSANASPSTSTAPLSNAIASMSTTIPRQKAGRKRTRSDLSRSTNGTESSTTAALLQQQQQGQPLLSGGTGTSSFPDSPNVPIKRLKMTPQRQPADLLKLHPASKPPSDPALFNIDHRNLLMSLFIPDPSTSSSAAAAGQEAGSSSSAANAEIEPTGIIASFPEDLDPDTPIDDHLHTALHWAAALARISTVKAIIQTGADPSRGNGLGETALMRAVLVTNNFDSETFAPPNGVEGLLSLLSPSLRTVDDADRTVLHHIALVAGIKGRSAAARHYMESILDWIINVESCPEADVRTLLNAKDANGDTALNIAARVGCRSIVRMLLESGADSLIPNKLGLRPGDFGLLEEGLQLPTEGEMAVDDLQSTPKASASKLPTDSSATSHQGSSAHVSAQLIETLQGLLSTYTGDFKAEVASRAESLERVRSQLFIATKELKDQRAQIVSLKEKVRAVDLSKWRIKNLERALEEEDKFDWTGRSTIDGEPAFDLPVKGSSSDADDLDENSAAVQASAFEHRGESSTLGALAAVNMPSSIEADPPLPPSASSSSSTPSPTDSKPSSNGGQTQLTLAQVRRMTLWYTRIIALLRERIAQTEQSAGDMELDARKVVKLCTGVQEDEEIDNMLSNLINALQSDTPYNISGNAGGGLDLQRVSAFMAKVRSQELA